MIRYEIKHRHTGAVIYSGDFASLSKCVEAAVQAKVSLSYANLYRTNLSRANLSGANLSRANLSGADLFGAYLYHADLSSVNLFGADLTYADLSSADLSGTYLSGAYLYRTYLSGANLSRANLSSVNLFGADLSGADLTGANLTGVNLSRADLSGADLTGTDLSGVNLTGVKNAPADLAKRAAAAPIIAPVVPHIDACILRAIEAGGSLNMSTWHTCDTTHCRAGWAIVLAGDAGADLEREFGSHRAGTMIYRASRPGLPAPWFYADNTTALADIRACAAADPLPPE